MSLDFPLTDEAWNGFKAAAQQVAADAGQAFNEVEALGGFMLSHGFNLPDRMLKTGSELRDHWRTIESRLASVAIAANVGSGGDGVVGAVEGGTVQPDPVPSAAPVTVDAAQSVPAQVVVTPVQEL